MARPGKRLKKAKRKCRRTLLRACRRTGTSACAVTVVSSTTTLAPPTTSTTSTTTHPAVTMVTSTTTSLAPTTTVSTLPDGLPHFRGFYLFEGTRTARDCPPLIYIPDGDDIVMDVTVTNGGFGTWLDGMVWGTDAEGERQAPPWSMYTVRDCAAETDDWCANAQVTVYGLPPPTPESPTVPATAVISIYFYATRDVCTIDYEGDFRRWIPPGGG